MREIQALHSRQKEEIESLFTRLGKVTHLRYINKKLHFGISIFTNNWVILPLVGCSGSSAPPSYTLSWQEEKAYQKQVFQIVQNQLYARQQESITAR